MTMTGTTRNRASACITSTSAPRERASGRPRDTCSIEHRFAGDCLPETPQVHRAEGAIVQPVAGTTRLSPDHAPVIGAHRSAVGDVAQGTEHLEHVDVAGFSQVWRLVKLPFAR